MIPRRRIDINWCDLLTGLAGSFLPGNRGKQAHRLEMAWNSSRTTLAALSVRSSLDALFNALDLPEGSEVLVSAITIQDMVTIIRAHGLVPVPIDLNTETLDIDRSSLESAINNRTRMILLAHLFGTKMDLTPVVEVASRHNLMVVEDCAQAYRADGYYGWPDADVAMFSFGPIKTATALGGALMTYRDPGLAERVRGVIAAWPVHSRWKFALRVCKYMVLMLLELRLSFTLFFYLMRASGSDYDKVIHENLRGFNTDKLMAEIRCQPSIGLLHLLYRRVSDKATNRRTIAHRIKAARLANRYLTGVERPGSAAHSHSYWVYPIICAGPGKAEKLRKKLMSEGFDATGSTTSLRIVDPPAGRTDREPYQARRLLAHVLYIPVYEGITDAEIRRMADVIKAGQY